MSGVDEKIDTIKDDTEDTEDKTVEEDEFIEFSFQTRGNKKKLAAVSEVFKAMIKHGEEDKKPVEIVDCSANTFSKFLTIIEDDSPIFKKHSQLKNLELGELMEMVYLIDKYDIKIKGLFDYLTARIDQVFTSIIQVNKVGLMLKLKEKYNGLPIYDDICETMTRRCACFILTLNNEEILDMHYGNADTALPNLMKEMKTYKEKLCKNCGEWKPSCKDRQKVGTLREGLSVSFHDNSATWKIIYFAIGTTIPNSEKVQLQSGKTYITKPKSDLEYCCNIYELLISQLTF